MYFFYFLLKGYNMVDGISIPTGQNVKTWKIFILNIHFIKQTIRISILFNIAYDLPYQSDATGVDLCEKASPMSSNFTHKLKRKPQKMGLVPLYQDDNARPN